MITLKIGNNICPVCDVKNSNRAFRRWLLSSKTWTRTLDPDPGSGPWTRALTLEPDPENLDPEMPGPSNTWNLKNLDLEKPGINIELKKMSDFREFCFIKTMCNVIYCL